MTDEQITQLRAYWSTKKDVPPFNRLTDRYLVFICRSPEFNQWLALQPTEKPNFHKGGFIPSGSGAIHHVPPISEPKRILGTFYEGRMITTESDPELFERVVKQRIEHLSEKHDAPIETSENEAQHCGVVHQGVIENMQELAQYTSRDELNEFISKYQGQNPKPTKEQSFREKIEEKHCIQWQIRGIENAIKILRMEQSKLQTQIENYG